MLLIALAKPAQLAKENKKFVYGLIREGARAKDFELGIEWLCNCGLLSAMSMLDIHTLIEKDRIFTEFKGALTEQYVMQQLRLNSESYIGYWTNERSTAEVDFVIQQKGEIIHHPTKAIRTSMLEYKKEDWMVNLPLYGIESISRSLG